MVETVVSRQQSAETLLKPPKRRRGVRFGRWRLRIATAIISCYVIIAIAGPLLVPYDPIATSTQDRLLPPGSTVSTGATAIFGTDQVGRDLFAQVLQGFRISIMIGAATLTLAGLIGVSLGVLAGYFGSRIDSVVMRLADVQLAFPGILLAIFIAALLGPSVRNVIIVLALGAWVVFARVTRAQVLATKKREFVDATRTLGAGTWHTVRTCILPACFAPVMIIATVELGAVVLGEASLSFLGLGTPQTTPSWGVTIANGRDYLATAWWISTIPGAFLALLVIAFGTLGDELRDRFDPKLKAL